MLVQGYVNACLMNTAYIAAWKKKECTVCLFVSVIVCGLPLSMTLGCMTGCQNNTYSLGDWLVLTLQRILTLYTLPHGVISVFHPVYPALLVLYWKGIL